MVLVLMGTTATGYTAKDSILAWLTGIGDVRVERVALSLLATLSGVGLLAADSRARRAFSAHAADASQERSTTSVPILSDPERDELKARLQTLSPKELHLILRDVVPDIADFLSVGEDGDGCLVTVAKTNSFPEAPDPRSVTPRNQR
jgi:hypothetical protein